MHIWLINPFDELPGEGPEQRYACLARHLAGRGHNVTWISSAFRHRKKSVSESGVYAVSRDGTPNLSILLIPAPPYRSNTSLKRLHSHRVWARNLLAHLLQQVKSGAQPAPNLILASTPPIEGAAAAIHLGSALNTKVIIDVMDRWPENWLLLLPSYPGVRPLGRLLLSPWFRLSKQVFRKADGISAQSQAFAKHVKNRGQSSEAGSPRTRHSSPVTPYVCYLGAQPLSHPPPLPSPPFHILYLGAMGHFYDIETVLQAMLLAKQEGRSWRLTLAGTDPDGIWQRRVADLDLGDSVSLPGYLQSDDLNSLLASSHVGLIPMDPASGVAVPYKAADYLAHGLPIVSSLPGELETHLLHSGAGLHYRFGEAMDLHSKLSRATETEFLIPARDAAHTLFRETFDRNRIYPKWAAWMESIAAP